MHCALQALPVCPPSRIPPPGLGGCRGCRGCGLLGWGPDPGPYIQLHDFMLTHTPYAQVACIGMCRGTGVGSTACAAGPPPGSEWRRSRVGGSRRPALRRTLISSACCTCTGHTTYIWKCTAIYYWQFQAPLYPFNHVCSVWSAALHLHRSLTIIHFAHDSLHHLHDVLWTGDHSRTIATRCNGTRRSGTNRTEHFNSNRSSRVAGSPPSPRQMTFGGGHHHLQHWPRPH